MIFEYECKKCGHEQEKWHRMNDKNTEPCEKCDAPAEKLKKILSAQRIRHGSWGRWSV